MFSSSAFPSMKRFGHVRQLWTVFEQWVETVPRVAMDKEILETFHEMDARWNATPTRTRPSKQEHDKSKAAFRRELEDGLVTLAREEWQRRLDEAGLKDEDWGEMTFKETVAVERLLGGDLDEEGMAIMESVARAHDADSIVAGLPALTNAARASNFSGYSFVSPTSLSIGDDLDDDAFESIFSSEILPNSAPESIVDEIFDTPTTVPWGWNGDSRSYGIWSANTSQSSRQSSQTGSPERPPPKTISADHTFFPHVAEPRAQFQPESSSAPSHRARAAGPRYIGPQLTDADVVFDDEADFERFKMETRVTKIREFHEEAARADIQLAQDIYNARKTSRTWRDDEDRRISEHEKRMVELRRLKEEERKEIVRAERNVRREAIRLRQLREIPMGSGAAESPRQRLTQEVESKLRLGSVFVSPEPVDPLAEVRHERRQSQSTINASQARSARPTIVPESDRLTADLPDLLAALASATSSTASSTGSSTPVSIASSSTSSSRNATARWLPPPEIVKVPAPTKGAKKKSSSPAVDLSAAATPKQQSSLSQGRMPSSERPSKSTSSAAEPSVVSPSVASFFPASLFAAPPPPVNKPVTSSASSSSSKAPSPATSKVPSPPATSKVPSPPATFKVPSPPATSKVPSPPVKSKVPSPPVTSKGQPPAAPLKRQPSKAQSPPTSVKAQSPPAHLAETPKPTEPVVSASSSASASASASALPQKKARVQVVEMQTPGASSSRTTLEQLQRPFIHKSLGSDSWIAPQIGSQPPPVPPGGPVWVSSSSAAKKADTAKAAPSSYTSHSAQIEKSTSMPQPRLPPLARPRRMSDPVSPSPRSFALPDNVQGELKPTPDAVPGIMKKAKGKQGKPKRVTIEEVSDEEDADTQERLPVDSKFIFEPKPSVPTTMFSHIIDFSSTPPPATPSTIEPDDISRPGNPRALSKESDGSGGFLTGDGKLAKEKHVRWTPSTVGSGSPSLPSSLVENGELRAALAALETNVLSPPSGAKKGPRSRASSVLQTGTVVDRKGKGKARAVEPETDDLAAFMKGATQDLTQMRGQRP
ncbi:hypothetical protein B0H19DRAFT_1130563 [Mycena capillaripes]|nr:hypothetical protein B0H19DRAFT_1130563 [Mycena capillaripes]